MKQSQKMGYTARHTQRRNMAKINKDTRTNGIADLLDLWLLTAVLVAATIADYCVIFFLSKTTHIDWLHPNNIYISWCLPKDDWLDPVSIWSMSAMSSFVDIVYILGVSAQQLVWWKNSGFLFFCDSLITRQECRETWKSNCATS